MRIADRTQCVNVARIRRLLSESDFDAMLVSSAEALPSVTAYYRSDVLALQEFPHYALWSREGAPCFVAPKRSGHVRSPIIEDHRPYNHEIQRKGHQHWRKGETTPIVQVASALRDRGLAKGRIGVEVRHLQLGYARELEALCPGIELADCEPLLDRIRAVRTPAEIELLRRAARATDKAVTLGLSMVRAGHSEKHARNCISSLLLQFGASSISHSGLCSGDRCRIQHHEGGEDDILEPGTVVATDYGGVFDGYTTDIARMARVGKVDRRQVDLHKRLGAVHIASMERIRAGLRVADLVQMILDEFSRIALPTTRTMFGHSLNIGVHDWPMITARSDAVLEAGMILAFENTTDDPVTGQRYGVEDILLVTDTGMERLSDYAQPDQIIVID